MPKRLPARPNLEHLRSQAKALLARLREGDPEAVRTFSDYLPEAGSLTAQQVISRGFRLADAQAAIARKSGFAAWPGLARHVDRLRSMEGKWAFRSLQSDGEVIPASMLTSSFLLIDGDRFRMESPEAGYEGIFLIDAEQNPNRIDIDFVEGPEAGNRCQGIFELEEDQLTFCLDLNGAGRPEQFVSRRGSGHALEELVRIEASRPVGVDGGTPFPAAVPPPQVAADPGDFDGPLAPVLEKLQGEWQALELVTSGKPLPASYLAFGYRIHSGAETKVIFGGQTMVHARMRANQNLSPIEIDYLSLAGKAKGSLSLGLFRWEGDEALFCMGSPGAARPTDFTCAEGSGRILSRWKRKDLL